MCIIANFRIAIVKIPITIQYLILNVENLNMILHINELKSTT